MPFFCLIKKNNLFKKEVEEVTGLLLNYAQRLARNQDDKFLTSSGFISIIFLVKENIEML